MWNRNGLLTSWPSGRSRPGKVGLHEEFSEVPFAWLRRERRTNSLERIVESRHGIDIRLLLRDNIFVFFVTEVAPEFFDLARHIRRSLRSCSDVTSLSSSVGSLNFVWKSCTPRLQESLFKPSKKPRRCSSCPRWCSTKRERGAHEKNERLRPDATGDSSATRKSCGRAGGRRLGMKQESSCNCPFPEVIVST